MKKEDIEKILKEANDKLGNYSDKQIEWYNSKNLQLNGIIIANTINKNQGKKNAESGHMKSIQPLGASKGGQVGGIITRDSGKLKEHSLLGNEANQQKYGKRIIAYNKNTEECWEYISIREAERDLKIQAPVIRKILRGEQIKTRCGWTFENK